MDRGEGSAQGDGQRDSRDELIPRFGYPSVIIRDNGPQFVGAKYQSWCRRNNISTLHVATYHQRANPVERRVQEVKKLLRLHMLQKSGKAWDRQLPRIMGTLRNRPNAATRKTPCFMVYGMNVPRKGEWNHPEMVKEAENRPLVEDRNKEARINQKDYQQKYTEPVPRTDRFTVGDMVMVRRFTRHENPFTPIWRGPYPVTKRLAPNIYEIEMEGAAPTIHVDDLRPAPTGEELMEESNEDSSDDEAPAGEQIVTSAIIEPLTRNNIRPSIIEPPAPVSHGPQPGKRRRSRIIRATPNTPPSTSS
ncbi:hypothetical protein NQ317_003560 [Molorchus minor]|uniref:Integrase catalytic domain-containing protein n=1 Tax=Molorchus minor TaxID=1323400 RepID=A0ABQ9J1F1_9CUCU|nr:hypothetical protein NQ317_003560 [Molorchus minor]